jgi:hypothetical protein
MVLPRNGISVHLVALVRSVMSTGAAALRIGQELRMPQVPC